MLTTDIVGEWVTVQGEAARIRAAWLDGSRNLWFLVAYVNGKLSQVRARQCVLTEGR